MSYDQFGGTRRQFAQIRSFHDASLSFYSDFLAEVKKISLLFIFPQSMIKKNLPYPNL